MFNTYHPVKVSSETGAREYRIALNDEERRIADAIDLDDDSDHRDAHEVYLANAQLIPPLMASLSARDAIPAHWLHYWTDPDCNPGRVKASRQGVFERNGCMGEDIYTHQNFIKHLRYMLLGCELPRHVGAAFLKKCRIASMKMFPGDFVASSRMLPTTALRAMMRSPLERYHDDEDDACHAHGTRKRRSGSLCDRSGQRQA